MHQMADLAHVEKFRGSCLFFVRIVLDLFALGRLD